MYPTQPFDLPMLRARSTRQVGRFEQPRATPPATGSAKAPPASSTGTERILRCLRDTGMPIARMLRYADLARAADETVAERIAVLEHERAVEEPVRTLLTQQRQLRDKIAWYRSVSPQPV